MDHPLIDLINSRIQAAERDGAFDNLEGAGRPLPRCDDPENAVMSRILRDNGAVPEAVALTNELARLRQELRDTADRSARVGLIRDIAMTETRLDIARRRG
ncbi:J-domain-containing protein [Antarctobacter jejuensis]|uniref:J-domain-containing protein n=1 Tax=Antarctobacter jejuensis TaxID=1439938 RepID=UPI003FCFF218